MRQIAKRPIAWIALIAIALLAASWATSLSALPSLRFADLWLTPDQQGRQAFERGDYAAAAKLFHDPAWQGVACYRAGDLACAAGSFAQISSPEGAYNLGNVYARTGELKLALQAYDRALTMHSNWREARENRAMIASLIKPPKEKEVQADEGQEATLDPDQNENDDRSKRGDPGQVDVQKLSAKQTEQLWLRSLHTDPALFLRNRFALESGLTQIAPEKH